MAEVQKYYWLKLKRDFFKRHDIRIIEEMPNGKDYVLFYLKLLLESIDHEGSLRFSDTIPYNEQMLSVVTNTNIDIVRSAMKLFVELNMMSVCDDQTIYMTEVEKLIGSESKWAEYKRNKKISASELPPLTVCKRISYERIELPNGKVQYVDEKRYGSNGGLAFDRAGGRCEVCGSEENLVIHHCNGYSNELEDLMICCKKCHGRLEKVQPMSKTLPIEKELELESESEKEFHSFIHSDSEDDLSSPEKRRTYLGGIGKGVVFLSDEQMGDLLDKMSVDEFDHYVGVIADNELKGHHYKKKTHYQAILDMAAKDRKVKR